MRNTARAVSCCGGAQRLMSSQTQKEIVVPDPVTWAAWGHRYARPGSTRANWQLWNNLVPEAQRLGIRRVRFIDPCWRVSRVEAQRRIDWLQAQVALRTSGTVPVTAPVDYTTEPWLDLGLYDQTFGVEFELVRPAGMTKEQLADHIASVTGAPCRVVYAYHDAHRSIGAGFTAASWKIVPDGSIRDAQGSEVVAPVLKGEAGFETLRAVARKLTEVGCTVNKNCGMHVHIGVQPRSRHVNFFKRLWRLYSQWEPTIDTVHQLDRRAKPSGYYTSSNAEFWCKSIVRSFNDARVGSATNLREFGAAVSNDKYRKLNYLNVGSIGTAEFRQHGGTVDATKAEMWVRLCMRMCAYAGRNTSAMPQANALQADSLEAFLALVGADADEVAYFTARREHFIRRAARAAAQAAAATATTTNAAIGA